MTSRLVLALACGVLALGCQRRAPGPAECHDLAERWLARETNGATLQALAPGDALAVDDAEYELTVECLTRPFDRELVECVVGGRAPKVCFSAFEKRKPRQALPSVTDAVTEGQ